MAGSSSSLAICGFAVCLLGTTCSGFTTPPTRSPWTMPATMTVTVTRSKTSRITKRRFAPLDEESSSTNSEKDDTGTDVSATATSTSTSTSTPKPKPPINPYIEMRYETYFDGTKPDSSYNLALNNFRRQGASLLRQGLETIGLVEAEIPRPPECFGFRLSNEAVTRAEDRRVAEGGGVDAHPVSRALYDAGCLVLDNLFEDRPIQRFWFLETIARIPYFSYISMLHLYESFGWFRGVELRKVHAAEDWNELHHLLIMESLGGNAQWSDRFLGYHVAFAYYWFLIAVYLGSPRIAYQFMELLEAHAVDTYTTFVEENRERLRTLPAPAVAASYYKLGDLYMFDDFMTGRKPGTRRPPCETLLDVFENIAIDEGEHVKTMQACQDYAEFGTEVISSHLRYMDDIDMIDGKRGENSIRKNADIEEKRRQWKEWSETINETEMEGMDRGSELNQF